MKERTNDATPHQVEHHHREHALECRRCEQETEAALAAGRAENADQHEQRNDREILEQEDGERGLAQWGAEFAALDQQLHHDRR